MSKLIATFLIAILLIINILIAYFARKKFESKPEISRKILHIGIGPILVLALNLNITKIYAIYVCLFVLLVLLLNFKFKFLNFLDDVDRKSYGIIFYCITILILVNNFWGTNNPVICISILIMALSDGFAGLIGQSFNSRNWLIFGQKKSIYGTTTFFVITLLILSIASLLLESSISYQSILIGTIFATSLEQISKYGIDNLTVPIFVSYFWTILN